MPLDDVLNMPFATTTMLFEFAHGHIALTGSRATDCQSRGINQNVESLALIRGGSQIEWRCTFYPRSHWVVDVS